MMYIFVFGVCVCSNQCPVLSFSICSDNLSGPTMTVGKDW